ncbi:glutathione S-transferase family protein [Novosphingobium sp.]|uniref:glutathione S-transferase family protein n=1 Tax=Novosphingobium sp. TaxID=1874826 RepID=UPI00286E19DF|nr:glutathione S-transferase family protein [Novosphingobium sp.]
MNDSLDAMVAEAGQALGQAALRIGGEATPRFALFHAPNSICSQKVRAVLAHHRIPYLSHSVNLFAGQTYLPEYVRLRMIGCASFGGALVSRHHGSTSASDGCDGVVVPTLVDLEAGEVIVDSKRICLMLDALMPDAERLRPADITSEIDAELTIVDELPNYPLLMGRKIGEAPSTPASRAAFSQRKIGWCDRHLAECGDEPALVAAYTAKRAKELSATIELFSPESMEAASHKVRAALDRLERALVQSTTSWLLGEWPTLADLFWGIQLIRLDDLDFDYIVYSHVTRYAKATRSLPALRSALLEWPGAVLR